MNMHSKWGKTDEAVTKISLKTTGLFLLVIAIAALITCAIFISDLLNVPDNSEKFQAYKNQLQERISKDMEKMPEQNAWTFFDAAKKKMLMPVTKVTDDGEYQVGGDKTDNPCLVIYGNLVKTSINEKNIEFCRKSRAVNRETLHLVEEAFRQPYILLPVDYSAGRYLDFEDSALIGALGYFLISDGKLMLYDKNHQGALDRYLQAGYLGKGLTRYNGLLSAILGLVIDNTSLINLVGVFENYEMELEGYRRIITIVQQREQEYPDMVDAVLSEMVLLDNCFEKLKNTREHPAEKEGVEFPAKLMVLLPTPVVVEREQKLLRDWFIALLDSGVSLEVSSLDSHRAVDPRYSVMALFFIPQYRRAAILMLTNRAYYSGLKTLAALKLYKLETGSYPDSLEQLTPSYLDKVPGDPFNGGKPLVYRKKGDGVLLYSFGPNRTDNGGIRNYTDTMCDTDLVFMVK